MITLPILCSGPKGKNPSFTDTKLEEQPVRARRMPTWWGGVHEGEGKAREAELSLRGAAGRRDGTAGIRGVRDWNA
ncbi:MAG: hypothetical protein AAFO91_01705 [Bacteroidota bacterium]